MVAVQHLLGCEGVKLLAGRRKEKRWPTSRGIGAGELHIRQVGAGGNGPGADGLLGNVPLGAQGAGGPLSALLPPGLQPGSPSPPGPAAPSSTTTTSPLATTTTPKTTSSKPITTSPAPAQTTSLMTTSTPPKSSTTTSKPSTFSTNSSTSDFTVAAQSSTPSTAVQSATQTTSSPTIFGPSQTSGAFSLSLTFAASTSSAPASSATITQTTSSAATTLPSTTQEPATSRTSTTVATQTPWGFPMSTTGNSGSAVGTNTRSFTMATAMTMGTVASSISTAATNMPESQPSAVPQATLNRQTRIGIGVGASIWVLITIISFTFWYQRRRKRKRQETRSAMFSEYDPEQVYFGQRQSQGIGAAVVKASQRVLSIRRPPAPPPLPTPRPPPPVAEVSRPWSFRSEDAAVERNMAPGLRSHPIATRNTIEDLAYVTYRRMLSDGSPPPPIAELPGFAHQGISRYRSTSAQSTESMTDPDFPFRTRSNSPDDADDAVGMLRPMTTTDSMYSVNEIRPLPPSLVKLRGWLEENRRGSRAVQMQSRWSETEDTASKPSRPNTMVRSSRGGGGSSLSVNRSKTTL